jgi:hypothetical protein
VWVVSVATSLARPPADFSGRRLASVSAKAVPEAQVFLFETLEGNEVYRMLNA